MGGDPGGWGGGGMGGAPYQAHMQQMQRPPQPGGQRRGIKRRGWEGAGGNAVAAAPCPAANRCRQSSSLAVRALC